MNKCEEGAPHQQEVDVKLLQLQRENNTPESKIPSIWFSKRFFVAILLFFGYVSYAMGGQVVSIAIVEMVSKKSDTSNNQTTAEQPKFQWNSLTVGIILNSFYYGSLFSPLGGYWSRRFGGVLTFGVSMMLAGLLVFLTPFSLSIHLYLFLLLRTLVGVFESFCNASNAEIFTRWFPKQERPIFMACVINGLYFGTAVTSPFCGFLIHKRGWPMAFYGTGVFCISWSLLWLVLVKSDPLNDKWISTTERNYIIQGTGNITGKNEPLQYSNVLSSTPFWALSLSKFAFGGGVTFIVAYFPTYIKDAAQTDINITGLLSSIPNFVNMLIIPIASLLMTHWQNHSNLKGTTIHKIILSTGFTAASSLFVVIAFANNFTISMICFVLIKILLSNNKVILELITVTMAPNHSSTVSGLSLFWQTIGSILTQLFIGMSVKNHKLEEWNICFLWAAGVLVIVALLFVIHGSSKPQSWSTSNAHTLPSE